MLPPPSSSLGRSHSIIILMMVDRGTDNWCQPPFALRVLAPDGVYVFTLVSVYVFTLVSVYVFPVSQGSSTEVTATGAAAPLFEPRRGPFPSLSY